MAKRTITTTIRVSTKTRDALNALAASRQASASDVVRELVDQASEESRLADAAAGFERLAKNPKALAAYREEAREIAADFDAPTPEW